MKQKVQNKEMLFALIESNRMRIRDYGVRTIGLFGSFARNEQNDHSDVDLLL